MNRGSADAGDAEEAGNERTSERNIFYPGQRERMSRQRETVGLESSWLETHLGSQLM